MSTVSKTVSMQTALAAVNNAVGVSSKLEIDGYNATQNLCNAQQDLNPALQHATKVQIQQAQELQEVSNITAYVGLGTSIFSGCGSILEGLTSSLQGFAATFKSMVVAATAAAKLTKAAKALAVICPQFPKLAQAVLNTVQASVYLSKGQNDKEAGNIQADIKSLSSSVDQSVDGFSTIDKARQAQEQEESAAITNEQQATTY